MRKKTEKILKSRTWTGKAAGALLALLYAGVFCLFALSSVFNAVKVKFDDQMYQTGESFSRDIRIVGITSEDVEKTGKSAGEIAALVLSELNSDSYFYPAAICLDVPADSISDEAAAILSDGCLSRGNVVLPVSAALRDDCLLSYSSLSDQGILAERAIHLPAELTEEAREGHVAHLEDSCGILRHAVFDIGLSDGSFCSSCAWETYCLYCWARGIEVRKPVLSLQNTALIKFASRSEVRVRTESASEVLSGVLRNEDLTDSVVLIGYMDSSLDRGFLTAVDYTEKMHSVELDAHIVNALISGSLSAVVPLWIQALLLFLSVLAVMMIGRHCRPLTAVLLCGLYILAERIVSMLLYGIGYAGYSCPHLFNALFTGTVSILLAAWHRGLVRQRELEKKMGQYVDPQITKRILGPYGKEESLDEELQENVKTEKIAVLFADIRGFTSISEKLPEEKLVLLLNRVLSLTADCVKKYGGTLDKFIGDCTMAYWGAPGSDEDSAYHACLAASEMQRMIRGEREKLKKEYGAEIHLGIGVNYGDAVVGSIGSADRMNFTAVGNTVNTASRLEEDAPADAVYISRSVMEKLGGRAETERLSGDRLYKGKEERIPVYLLHSISVRSGAKKEEAPEPAAFGLHRRGRLAVSADLFLFLTQLLFAVNCIREYGIAYISYYTVNLSVISCIIAALLIPFDIQAAKRADGVNLRPRWLDILLLTQTAANLHVFGAVLFRAVRAEGAAVLISGESWPGGFVISLLCPAAALLSFFILQIRSRCRLSDILLAGLPLFAVLLGSSALAERIGLRYSAPQLYKAFYQLPAMILSAGADLLLLFVLAAVNEKLRVHNLLILEKYGTPFPEARLKNFRLLQCLRGARARNLIFLALDISAAVFSVRVPITALKAGGIRIYSNPALVSIIVCGCSLIAAVFRMTVIAREEDTINRPYYRYLSFMRMVGCQLNFCTVLVLALNGEGLSAFFMPRYSADATVFLLCPAFTLFMWALERNEYSYLRCMLTTVPFVLIPPLSRAAILTKNLDAQYSYELETFYNTKQMAVIIGAIFLIATVGFYLNYVFLRSRNKSAGLFLTVCGNRTETGSSGNTSPAYGLHTECYVLRDGDYALVLQAGTGLSCAAEKLRGCRKVDILLPDRKFAMLAGFLSVGNVCPEAHIRAFAPFDIRSFSVNPFWPVNLIKASPVISEPGRRFRLRRGYSALFLRDETDPDRCFVKITGRTGLFYTGNAGRISAEMKKQIQGSDWLIASGAENAEAGCYLAIDAGVPHLLLSGFRTSVRDEEIDREMRHADRILSGVSAAVENREYPV